MYGFRVYVWDCDGGVEFGVGGGVMQLSMLHWECGWGVDGEKRHMPIAHPMYPYTSTPSAPQADAHQRTLTWHTQAHSSSARAPVCLWLGWMSSSLGLGGVVRSWYALILGESSLRVWLSVRVCTGCVGSGVDSMLGVRVCSRHACLRICFRHGRVYQVWECMLMLGVCV